MGEYINKIVNKKAVVYYLTYLVRQLTGKIPPITPSIPVLMRKWVKKRELNKELFYTATTNLKRMWGDCDDFVTLMATKLKREGKKFKIGFCIRGGGAYHVFIVSENVLLDPWISRSPIKFNKKYYRNAQNIVLFDINFRGEWL